MIAAGARWLHEQNGVLTGFPPSMLMFTCEDKMSQESQHAALIPVLRCPPRSQVEVTYGGRWSGQGWVSPTTEALDTTETLFITPVEQQLWEQLVGLLSPCLWGVKVSGGLQGDTGMISFSGPLEVILRAKEAISKLLILVGSLVKVNLMAIPRTEHRAAGFFHLREGFHLFLWEGEASRFKVDALVRIRLPGGGVDGGNAVFAQRVWSQEGSFHTNLDIHLPPLAKAEVAAGTMKLALEAASQRGLQSLVISDSGASISTAEAEAMAVGIEAFKKDHPISSLKSISFVSRGGKAVELFREECRKRWSPGKDNLERLRNALLTLEAARIEVAAASSTRKKTDVVVVPLVVDSDGLGWGPDAFAVTEKALRAVPRAVDLLPGEILPVTASYFPELDCSVVYLVWLEGSQLKPKDACKQAIQKMVWNCLCTCYGSFLESISFPLLQPADPGLAAKGDILMTMLEEMDRFLKEVPNTWMKLVQIVPPSGRTLPHLVEDYITAAVEPVGLCHLEDPLFLQYLEESPDAFHEFEVRLKEVGYSIRLCSPWGMLMFQATGPPVQLHELGTVFHSVRERYLLHCEIRPEVLEALLEQQTLVKMFTSIRIYIWDRMWFVGLFEEIDSFLRRLVQVASQRQVVSWECLAESLPRCTIAKDAVLQEMLPSNPLVSIEILTKAQVTIRFWGRRQRVEEAMMRFKELLNAFQVWPVPLSNLQFHFIKTRWGEFFHNDFFLEQGLLAVLEISEVIQVAGLDLVKMKEAKEIIMKQVLERTVEIPEELRWTTECAEWKELLHSLGSHKEVALHQAASQQVTVVGLSPRITEVEESIKEYLQDNSLVEETMTVARPELLLAGESLLHIMDWKHLKVSIQLQSHGQILSLHLSGLRKYVRKATPVIKMDLNSLVLGSVPLRKKALGEYFFGVGACLLKQMAQRLCCVTKIKNRSSKVTNSKGSWERGFVEGYPGMIYALGRENQVVSFEQILAGFIATFHEESICDEAIATFSDENLNKLHKNTRHQFPVGLHRLRDEELQICGSQGDVANILQAIHAQIEEYQAEWIEVMAQYKAIPSIIVKECLFEEILPANRGINAEVLAENPPTVIFRGPRQKAVEAERSLEEMLSGFQVLPVPLSNLKCQFVKAQWDELFHESFFLGQGLLAVLQISEVIQVAGLDLVKMKEAKEIIMRQVLERTVEIPEELRWTTECAEWKELLHSLGSYKEVALHQVADSQVTVVGLSPRITEVEESIKEYLRDNSPMEERMDVARPELALAGENLLHIMDWEDLKVKVQLHPNGQILSLHLSGLRKFVQEAIQIIKEDLASLVLGMIPLKTKALGEYFLGSGACLLQEMAQERDCTARMQIQQSSGPYNGVINSYGNEQDLAEEHWAAIHVVGRESDVTSFKQVVADFIANFHEETICSAEISAFSDNILKELCDNTSHQFPVVLHRPKEKVARICGAQEDVENILGAIYTKIEEAFLTKLQEAHAEWIESKLLYETIRWHRMTDAGWSTFDMNTNRRLEMAYHKKKMWAQLPWDGQTIKINWLKGEAFLPSKAKFRIRREICLWDKNIAPQWEAMDGSLVKKVELQTSSEEYQDVVKNFKRTASDCTVLKVERIQNRYLWVSYSWKRSWMEKKNPEGTQNERILYHGTCPENWYSIHEIGFKSTCRKVGLYGQGIYFAGDASRSAFYAKPDSQGHRYMFQARVLTGEYDCGSENMVLPPTKRGGRGRYDSLVDVLSKPTIFVTFFDDHAYPEYLITFNGLAS
ncbi:uncharacterized protein LOC134405713 [Elgaria multicarinata webbii]|uniref:uncharacterized protein LOC134405713 n=1 Tax=Elgaria multicarinata webbii TaxID=159646 RepID=UPI002FCD14C4